MKNQLDLLQTSVEQRKSFRTLSLLINKIKESVEELKTNLDSIMMEKVSSSSINSVMKRQSNLISRLENLELEVNGLDDDGQLSQSSTRVRDDISCVSQSSGRQLKLHQLTPVSKNSEQNNMTVKNRRNHRFSFRKQEINPTSSQNSFKATDILRRILEN